MKNDQNNQPIHGPCNYCYEAESNHIPRPIGKLCRVKDTNDDEIDVYLCDFHETQFNAARSL